MSSASSDTRQATVGWDSTHEPDNKFTLDELLERHFASRNSNEKEATQALWIAEKWIEPNVIGDSRGTAQDNQEPEHEEREVYVRTETTTAISMPNNDVEMDSNWEKLVGYDKYGNAITERNKQLYLDETWRVQMSGNDL